MTDEKPTGEDTPLNHQDDSDSACDVLVHRVSCDEVKELLRQVGNGEVVPKLKDPTVTWADAGDIGYIVDGWEVVIFNDCDDWDYVDSVIAPDGRCGEFDDWFGTEDADGHRLWMQPDCLLDREDSECYLRMTKAFEEAV